MWKRLGVTGLALAAMIAAAFFLLTPRTGGRPDTTTPAVEVQTLAPSLPGVPAALDLQQREPEGRLRLTGEVLDEARLPVADAEVTLAGSPPRRVRTGPDGFFSFERLLPRTYSLTARKGAAVGGPLELRVRPTSSPVVVVLATVPDLEVVVLDSASRSPLAGAWVGLEGSSVSGVTNGQGKVHLEGVGAGRQVVRATAAGHAPGRRVVLRGSGGRTAEVSLLLRAGAAVSGRVEDETGAPVVGVVIRALPTATTAVAAPFENGLNGDAVTDSSGRWTLPAVPAGSFRFAATHPHFAPALSPPVALDGETARSGVDLTLRPAARLRGRVVDVRQAPVPGARVEVRTGGNGGRVGMRAEALTDELGRFELDGLPSVRVRVDAKGERGAALAREVDLTGGDAEVTLVLDTDGAVSGEVVDADGVPVAGAQVVAVPEDRGRFAALAESRVGGYSAVLSDDAGRFTLGGLEEGAYQVRASVVDTVQSVAFWMAPGVIAHTGDREVQVVLHAPGTVTGRVSLPDGGAPELFSVGLTAQVPVWFRGQEGTFSLKNTPVGTWRLRVSAPGFASVAVDRVKVSDGAVVDLGRIELKLGRTLRGAVRDDQGRPVEGAQVQVAPQILGDGSGLGGALARTTTDAEGTFTLSGLEQGPLMIVAEHERVGRSDPVPVPEGEPAPMELRLKAQGALEGVVRRAGRPLGNVPVVAQPPGSATGRFMVTTQEDGHFQFDRLAEGPYLVTAVVGDGPTAQIQQSIATEVEGTRGEVDVDVESGPGALEVQLVEAGGAPLQKAQVYLATGAVNASTLGELEVALSRRGEGQTRMALLLDGQPLHFRALRAGPQTLCAVPIRGDLDDPAVSQALRDHAGALPVQCMQVQISALGPPRTVVFRLPSPPGPNPE